MGSEVSLRLVGFCSSFGTWDCQFGGLVQTASAGARGAKGGIVESCSGGLEA